LVDNRQLQNNGEFEEQDEAGEKGEVQREKGKRRSAEGEVRRGRSAKGKSAGERCPLCSEKFDTIVIHGVLFT